MTSYIKDFKPARTGDHTLDSIFDKVDRELYKISEVINSIVPGVGDEKVAIDSGATAGYIGAASNDGVLRTGSPLTYSDNGDYVTLGVDETAIDHDNLTNTHGLTTDIDHNAITNTHNLTTDIDHDTITNSGGDQHIDWTNAVANLLTTGTLGAGGPWTLTENGDTATLSCNGTDFYLKWSDGVIWLMTDEGTDTNTWVYIAGKGTGYGGVRIYDQDNAERTDIYTFNGVTYINNDGTSPQGYEFRVDNAKVLGISDIGALDWENVTWVPPGTNTLSDAVTAMSSGDTLILGSGTYTQTSAIAIPTSVTKFEIRGAGIGCTLIDFTSDVDGFSNSTGSDSYRITRAKMSGFAMQMSATSETRTAITIFGHSSNGFVSPSITLDDIAIIRTSSTQHWGMGVDLINCYNPQLRNVYFRGRKDTGSITAFADGGGGTVVDVTSVGHGLSTGDEVVISNTTNYNGTFTVTYIDDDTFEITDTWVSDDATGDWICVAGTAIKLQSCVGGNIIGGELFELDVGVNSIKAADANIYGSDKHSTQGTRLFGVHFNIVGQAVIADGKSLGLKIHACGVDFVIKNGFYDTAYDSAGGHHEISGGWWSFYASRASINNYLIRPLNAGTRVIGAELVGSTTITLNGLGLLNDNCSYCTATGNVMRALNYAVYVQGDKNVITGNSIYTPQHSTYDIYVHANADHTVITGNNMDKGIDDNCTGGTTFYQTATDSDPLNNIW